MSFGPRNFLELLERERRAIELVVKAMCGREKILALGEGIMPWADLRATEKVVCMWLQLRARQLRN
jgi:hypothetical protein